MLIRTMVLVALIAALSETIVYGAGALARMALHARQAAAMREAFAGAVALAQQAAISHVVPQPSATCAFGDERGCAVTIVTTIALPTPEPSLTPPSCGSGGCTIYTQDNTHVAESRTRYTIAQELRAGNGDLLSARRATVAFRTFATPPYAALVGSLDQTLDSIANGGTGDDGGNASGGASTLIHVEYRRSGSGELVPGDVWRPQDERPATAPPSWDR